MLEQKKQTRVDTLTAASRDERAKKEAQAAEDILSFK